MIFLLNSLQISRSEAGVHQWQLHSPTRLCRLWGYAAERRRETIPDGPQVGHLPCCNLPASAIPPHLCPAGAAKPIMEATSRSTDGTMCDPVLVDPMSQLPGHFKDNKNSCQNIIAAAIGSKSLITPGLHRSYQSQVPQKVPCQW